MDIVRELKRFVPTEIGRGIFYLLFITFFCFSIVNVPSYLFTQSAPRKAVPFKKMVQKSGEIRLLSSRRCMYRNLGFPDYQRKHDLNSIAVTCVELLIYMEPGVTRTERDFGKHNITFLLFDGKYYSLSLFGPYVQEYREFIQPNIEKNEDGCRQ